MVFLDGIPGSGKGEILTRYLVLKFRLEKLGYSVLPNDFLDFFAQHAGNSDVGHVNLEELSLLWRKHHFEQLLQKNSEGSAGSLTFDARAKGKCHVCLPFPVVLVLEWLRYPRKLLALDRSVTLIR